MKTTTLFSVILALAALGTGCGGEGIPENEALAEAGCTETVTEQGKELRCPVSQQDQTAEEADGVGTLEQSVRINAKECDFSGHCWCLYDIVVVRGYIITSWKEC